MRGLLGGTFAAIGLFKDTFMTTGEATLAGRTLLGANTFHFQATTDGAGASGRE